MQKGRQQAHSFRPRRNQSTSTKTLEWSTELAEILNEYNHMKASGNGPISSATRKARSASLYRTIRTLHELGNGIENPVHLKPKHIQKLVDHWKSIGKSPLTIENALCHLRVFSSWIGKGSIVKSLVEYDAQYTLEYAASMKQGFTRKVVDFWEIWERVCRMDEHVGMQMLFVKSFDVRRKEAVLFKPLKSKHRTHVDIFSGGTRGRRTIAIDGPLKSAVMDMLKYFVSIKGASKTGHLGASDKSVRQALARYSYVLSACGLTKNESDVTGPEVRGTYLIDKLISLGVQPTIWNGSGDEKAQIEMDVFHLKSAEESEHSFGNFQHGIFIPY